MRKLFVVWSMISFLMFLPAISRAFVQVPILAGIGLVAAGGAEVALPAATAAGVNAAWTGIVTAIGGAVSYVAFKDATALQSEVRLPLASPVPQPSAPGTAGSATSYQVGSGPVSGSKAAACSAYVTQVLNQSQSFCTQATPCTGVLVGTAPSEKCQAVLQSGANFSSPSTITATITCPPGYTASGGNCLLSSARAAAPDKKCDISRSGTTYSYYSDDPDCSLAGAVHGTVGNGGTTLELAGTDEFGNPVRNVVTAQTNGATQIQQQVQLTDGAGNSVITTKTLSLDSGGNVVGQSQSSALGSLTQADGQTATVTAAPAGSTQSATPQINIPTDYNREATQQQIEADLDKLHTDLTTQTTAADDPVPAVRPDIFAALNVDGFASLTSWHLPAHASTCPTMDFYAFGNPVSVNAHCSLMTTNLPSMSSAFVLIYFLVALFIVLGA